MASHYLIEDVVASLFRQLECHSRLLQQIYIEFLNRVMIIGGKRIIDEHDYCGKTNLQVSISAEASFPVVPK